MAKTMFGHLTKYKIIFVTGSQRSGTQICTKMISLDTKRKAFSENNYSNDIKTFYNLINRYSNDFVIQCPEFVWDIINFNSENNLVIYVKRTIEDVVKSMKIAHYNPTQDHVTRYGNLSPEELLIAKYEKWKIDRKHIINSLEIKYESLKDHPAWVPKEMRHLFDLKTLV